MIGSARLKKLLLEMVVSIEAVVHKMVLCRIFRIECDV
jgi:hypothetical protein